MDNPKMRTHAAVLESSFKTTLEIAAGVPETRRLRPFCPGKAHPLWLMGHLANTLDSVGWQWGLGKPSELPPEYFKLFRPEPTGGAPITTAEEDYPGWDEVVEHYRRITHVFVEETRGLPDTGLAAPAKGKMPERLRDHFPTVETVLTQMIKHDSHHRGQISILSTLPESKTTG